MSWTALTYAFNSVLTSAKMTQNQANFTALAQGLSGAPAILKAALPASVAHEDEANVFTLLQKIKLANAAIELDATTGDPVVRLFSGGVNKCEFGYDSSEDEFSIGDAGIGDVVTWAVATGKQTLGIVPLARMGTSVVDASTAVAGDTNTLISLSAVTDAHRFYVYSIRRNDNGRWINGSVVTVSETVSIGPHSFIGRASTSIVDILSLVNGTGGSITGDYKVYELTET